MEGAEKMVEHILKFKKTNINMKRGEQASSAVINAVFIIIGISMLIPFIWMLMISFKLPIELIQKPMQFFPDSFNLVNYRHILQPRFGFGQMYINSIKITSINVVGGIFTSALAGYAFARLSFKGRDFIFLLYLSTLIIPPEITIIPRFILFDKIGIIDSHLSLILPGLFSVIGTFMLRQYFLQVPFELSEAACIDGACEYRTFFQIILPLAKPALMSILILNFSWHWNDYQSPLVFLRSRSLMTLPLGLNFFADENSDFKHLVATASVLTSFPMIMVFLAAQKYFIKGLTAGAIKG